MAEEKKQVSRKMLGILFVCVFVFPCLLGAGIAPFLGEWQRSGCQEILKSQRVISVDAPEMTGKLGSGNVFDSSH